MCEIFFELMEKGEENKKRKTKKSYACICSKDEELTFQCEVLKQPKLTVTLVITIKESTSLSMRLLQAKEASPSH